RDAYDRADAAWHDAVRLLQAGRRVFARLLPGHFLRDPLHLVVGVGDSLQAAVLGVRPARLKRHHERLPCRVHNRLGDLEAPLVNPGKDFQANAHAGLDPGVAPGGDRGLGGLQQRVDVRLGVTDAQGHAVGRDLVADDARAAGLVDAERLVQA